MKIVDIDLVRRHCNAIEEDDELLSYYADVAEEMVTAETRRSEAELKKMGGGEWPQRIKQAVLLVVAHFYKTREAVGPISQVITPYAYNACIKPYRKFGDAESTADGKLYVVEVLVNGESVVKDTVADVGNVLRKFVVDGNEMQRPDGSVVLDNMVQHVSVAGEALETDSRFGVDVPKATESSYGVVKLGEAGGKVDDVKVNGVSVVKNKVAEVVTYFRKTLQKSAYHAGDNSTASGSQSMAIGNYARATGTASTAVGFYTNAINSYETALGTFNKTVLASDDAYKQILSVGNAKTEATRNNALIITGDGSMLIAPISKQELGDMPLRQPPTFKLQTAIKRLMFADTSKHVEAIDKMGVAHLTMCKTTFRKLGLLSVPKSSFMMSMLQRGDGTASTESRGCIIVKVVNGANSIFAKSAFEAPINRASSEFAEAWSMQLQNNIVTNIDEEIFVCFTSTSAGESPLRLCGTNCRVRTDEGLGFYSFDPSQTTDGYSFRPIFKIWYQEEAVGYECVTTALNNVVAEMPSKATKAEVSESAQQLGSAITSVGSLANEAKKRADDTYTIASADNTFASKVDFNNTASQLGASVGSVGEVANNALTTAEAVRAEAVVGAKIDQYSQELTITDNKIVIPMATTTTPGVVIPNGESFALMGGNLIITQASASDVQGKSDYFRPLMSSNVDDIVKVGITTNSHELTDEEKSKAQKWLGVTQDWVGTQDEYDALTEFDENVKYYIV